MKTMILSLALLLGLFSVQNASAQCSTEGEPAIRIGEACVLPGSTVEIPIMVENWNDVIYWHLGFCIAQAPGINMTSAWSNVSGQTIQIIPATGQVNLHYGPALGCGGPTVSFADGTVIARLRFTISTFASPGACEQITLCNLSPSVPSHVGTCSESEYNEFAPGSCPGSVCVGGGDSYDVVGFVRNMQGQPVPGVSLTNSVNGVVALSGSSGIYIFPGLPTNGVNSIVITPNSLPASIVGITQADIDAIRAHILGVTSLDCYQMIAADVTGEGNISTFDLVRISQSLTGGVPVANVGQWDFVPADFNLQCTPFQNTVPAHPSVATITNFCDHSFQDFIAIKLGDVTGEATSKMTAEEVAEAAAADRVEIAPNPFSDKVTLRFSVSQPASAVLRIYDLSGRALEVRSLDLSAGAQEISLEAREWPAGMLMYELTTADGRYAGRMLHLAD